MNANDILVNQKKKKKNSNITKNSVQAKLAFRAIIKLGRLKNTPNSTQIRLIHIFIRNQDVTKLV